jgi:hypothetical protein
MPSIANKKNQHDKGIILYISITILTSHRKCLCSFLKCDIIGKSGKKEKLNGLVILCSDIIILNNQTVPVHLIHNI